VRLRRRRGFGCGPVAALAEGACAAGVFDYSKNTFSIARGLLPHGIDPGRKA